MESFPYKLMLVSTFVVLSFCAFMLCKVDQSNEAFDRGGLTKIQYEKAAETYQTFCASCHGLNLEAFVDREWMFGSEKENVIHSITYGQTELGMVSFEQIFSKEQIGVLATYIISEVKKTNVAFVPKPGPPIMKSEVVNFRVDTIISGLEIPWGMTFLPNGDLLFTERKGELYRFSKGKLSQPIAGLPNIFAFGQGGLMDIELHPDYEKNGWIYFSFTKKGPGNTRTGNTAIGRAKLKDNNLVDYQELFVATPWSNKGPHFGCKLAFDGQGHLFFGVGDRGYRDQNPQSLTNHSGKIHRLNDDGTIPSDNPFVNVAGAMKSIYSYGHRNPQGTAIHPETGEVWETEHGPKGGDEINWIRPGLNYGWPIISYGINYNGTVFTELTHKEGMEQPIHYYVPSIAPCGLDFVDSDRYPGWKNNMLIGSLSFKYLERVLIEGHDVVHTEKLLEDIGRVRNVKVSPDGYVYVAIEKPGKILKLVPVGN